MSDNPLTESQPGREFTDEFGNVWRWVDGHAEFVRGRGKDTRHG